MELKEVIRSELGRVQRSERVQQLLFGSTNGGLTITD